MDRRRLDELRDGVAEPRAALAEARALLPSVDGRDALFAGSREWLLSLVLSDAFRSAEIEQIKSTYDRLGALSFGLAQNSVVDPMADFAIRMSTLAYVAADVEALRESYDVESLRDQPFFKACLTTLHEAGGSMARKALLAELGLKEANGTRVLKALDKARLINRRSGGDGAGNLVTVELTPLGKKTAMKWASPPGRDETPTLLVLRHGHGIPGMTRSHFPAAKVAGR
ncbi:hypothetical protein [uncultured Brevundimonas sp.]|uniref:hypothetical protein n=1 Tax=uncultured Brevundimonas sp. TaxID=213418 RepID=UPI0025D58E27|nr:hypothetical protein [uncultured Brevundimonas sp.]